MKQIFSLLSLSLQNYRNFSHFEFKFESSNLLIYAPNGSGKTNLLEAIHFALSGDPLRHKALSELIQFQNTQTIIKLKLKHEFELRLAISITQSPTASQLASRQIMLNGNKTTYKSVSEQLPPSVLFTPKMISILDTTNSARRDYFDEIISRANLAYAADLLTYENLLKKRNKLLSIHAKDPNTTVKITLYDDDLILLSHRLQLQRKEVVNQINQEPLLLDFAFQVVYTPSIMDQNSLKESLAKSIILKTTPIGAHRDSFEINFRKIDTMTWQNVSNFGSRSEQRLALLFLKLFALRYLEEKLQKGAILLLDDFFSEFDEKHIQAILQLISSYQTILSSSYLDWKNIDTSALQVINL